MKIPDTFIYNQRDSIAKLWAELALQIGAEYGIYVTTVTKWEGRPKFGFSEIVFRVGEHEFGSIKELRKALENKAFL